MTINPATGAFAWTPSESQGGTSYTATVTVTDDGTNPDDLTDVKTFMIAVQDVNVAPVLAPIGNQSVDEQATLSFTASATDQDLPGQTLTFSLDPASLALGMSINASSGAFTWTPGESQGGATYTATITVTDNGSNPVNLSDSETISITVNEVNVAPVLAPIGNQSVDEQATLSFTPSAGDQDLPAQTLTFSLDAAAVALGMTINPATGAFAWTPSESQGGASYSATITVTDNGSNPANLSHSETISIGVNEVNVAPVLAPIGNQSVDEQATLSFTASATDEDLPAQTLTFSLDPAAVALGMTINPATGAFAWTPSESQGGAPYTATVTVTDDGTNPDDLTDMETFTIAVQEVNVAPVLAPIGNQSVDEQATLSFTASAADQDLPAQTLTFSLDAASLALGMSVNPSSGAFSWMPSESQGGASYTATVKVTDDGTNPDDLTDAETFTVAVQEVNVAPVLAPIGNQRVDEHATLSFTASAADQDLPPQTLTFSLDPASLASGMSINASSGAFSWTPSESHGGTSFTVTVTVTDDGTNPDNLTDAETFTIAVQEVNAPPVLDPIGDKTVDRVAELTFTVSASDPDLPPNVLTFSANGLNGTPLPAGAVFDPQTQQFSWRPTLEQGPGTYYVTFAVSDNGLPAYSDFETIRITVMATAASKFFVADGAAHATFFYGSQGEYVQKAPFVHPDSKPRGIASNAAGNRIWVIEEGQSGGVERGRTVSVYDGQGRYLWQWQAQGLGKSPEGITTDGTNIWILDRTKLEVLFYPNGANNGPNVSQNYTSSFPLYQDVSHPGNEALSNTHPYDLVTDGTRIWVLNDFSNQEAVFVYTVGGTFLGSWRLGPEAVSPTGITLNPNGGNDLWTVDRDTERVYHYPQGRVWEYGRTYAATDSFELYESNANDKRNFQAEGIADPEGDPEVTITATDPTATEEGPTTGQYTVTRSGGTANDLTVYYTVGGTADYYMEPDYSGLPNLDGMGSGWVTIAAGSASATMTLTPSDDALVESDETAIVTLSPNAGYTVGAAPANAATVTISDNDVLAEVTITATDPTATEEGPTSGQYTVTRSGSTANDLTVYYTVGGTADYYMEPDYSGLPNFDGMGSGWVTIPAGSASTTMTLTPYDDAEEESNETVIVTLSSESGYLVGTVNAATVTINDNDGLPPLAFDSTSVSVNEAAGIVTFAVTLTSPVADTITVDYATANGTAAAGADYTAVAGTLTFNSGQTNQTVTVPILDDAGDEPDETFAVSLSNPTNARIATPSATITILDNDVPSIGFSSTSVSTTEDAGSLTFTVTLTSASDGTVAVDYATGDLSAVAGSDYTSTSGTLNFAVGQTSRTVTVPILDDTAEEPAESFTLALSNPANATIGTSLATGTILANDPPSLAFDSTSVSAAEGAGSVALTVTLSFASLNTVTVGYATSNVTAAAGADYTATSGTLTFMPGERSKTVTVPILEDATDEPDEAFALTLANPANATIGTPQATAAILDNDVPSINFSSTSFSASEGAGSVSLTVTLTSASADTITVGYSTSDLSAVAGVDYTATSGTLTFAPGQMSKTVAVPTLDDAADEPDERIVLTLANPANAALGTSQATATILDNDVPAGGVYWITDGDGAWDEPANWSINAVPDADDDVVIDRASGSYTVTVPWGVTASVRSLILAENLVIGGYATLNVSQPSLVNGTLTLAGGTFDAAGSVAVAGSLALAGGMLSGTGGVTVAGTLDWTAGSMTGTGTTTIAAAGLAGLSGAETKALERSLVNLGRVEWAGNGPISFVDPNGGGTSGTIRNELGAMFEAQTSAALGDSGYPSVTARFTNLGTFRKTTDSSRLPVGVAFDNDGLVEVQAGTLALDGGGVSTGTFALSAGAELEFNSYYQDYTLAAGSEVTGLGTLEFAYGTVNVNGDVTLTGDVLIDGGNANFNAAADLDRVVLTSGSLGGSAPVTISGTLDWTGGSMTGSGTTTIAAAGTLDLTLGSGSNPVLARDLTNAGTVHWTGGGTLSLADGAKLTNAADATFEVRAGVTLARDSSSSTGAESFQNEGTLVHDAANGWSYFDVPLANSLTGLIAVDNGMVQVRGGGASAGDFQVASGGTLDFYGDSYALTADSHVTGAGMVAFSTLVTVDGHYALDGQSLFQYGTAVFNGNATTANAVLSYGEVSGTGNLTITQALDWTGGQMIGTGRTTIAPTGSLNLRTGSDGSSRLVLARDLYNAGMVQWTGHGEFALSQGAGFWNESGGVFEARGNGRLALDANTGDEAFVNAGTFRKVADASLGTTEVSVPFTNTGPTGAMEVQAGALWFSDLLTTSGAVTIFDDATLAVGYYMGEEGSSGTYVQTTGSTHLLGGRLSASEIDVQGGVLSGDGTLQGDVTNAGEIQPGLPLGVLWVIGDYAQTATGTLRLDIAGPDPGSGHDQLHVTGAVQLAGTLAVDASAVSQLSDEYVLVDNDASEPLGGGFNGLPEDAPVLVAGETHRYSYAGGTGNDFTLRFPLAVSIGDVAQSEGDSGTTSFAFPVTLSRPLSLPIAIRYTTQDGTARAPDDYAAAVGTVSFAPGETQMFATVTVHGDDAAAAAETFQVEISSSAASLEGGARTTAVGTIENDDNEQLAAEGRFVFTVTEDFLEGRRSQTTAVEDELRLDPGSSGMFPFVNIAASVRGSVIRIDTRTGEVVGEYDSAPGSLGCFEDCPGTNLVFMGHNPSRTTVDLLGNVWVANRDEYSEVTRPGEDPDAMGSVTRIGVIAGGTRGRKNPDGSFTPDPDGEYLQGPFDYSTAIDRDGDGLIRTSRGLGDILPWTNSEGVDSLGGVSSAEDELILNYTRTVGSGTRTVAVDPNNDIWVGGFYDDLFYNEHDHEKISGETGLPVPGTRFNLGTGGYGGLVDGHGVLWSARGPRGLLRFVPNPNPPPAGVGQTFNDRGNYGLALDPQTGHIWHSSYYGAYLYELDASGTIVNSYQQPFSAQGLTVDSEGHVWMVEARPMIVDREQRVWHLAPDPANPGRHIPVGELAGFYGITGAAVDADGKIWVPGSGSDLLGIPPYAYRIDPHAGPVGAGGYPLGAIDLQVPLGDGAGPYNYSDMTGFVSWNAFAHGTWIHTVDSENLGNLWHSVLMEATIPEGAAVELHVRAANDRAVLDILPYEKIEPGEYLSNDVSGRYLEVRLTLRASDQTLLPSVQELVINAQTPRPRIAVESPADESRFDVDAGTIITGHALAGHPQIPLAAVLVNGTPVDALDASGTFFTRATIGPGYNTFEFTAVDVAGQTATETLTLVGVPSDPSKVRWHTLTDLAEFTTAYHRTSFNERDNVLYADLDLTNSGPYAVDGPLYLGITNISDSRVHVYQPDGVSSEGIPYFDFSDLSSDGVFAPGEMTAEALTLAFANPSRVPFTYDLVLVGATNRPPEFVTVPVVSTPQDQPYQYHAQAIDPDGEAVSYSLTTQPLDMTIDAVGIVSWPANEMFLGNHAVTIRASDGRGGWAEQPFTLTVHAPVPNRPPVFDSVPVVTAYVGNEYTYDADASDSDGDALSYSLAQQPFSEMEIDPATGFISDWIPQADQVGDYEVKISVTDSDPVKEGIAEQRFVLRVLAEAGNQSPAIISPPISEVLTGTAYRYQVVAVDPDRDDRITYALDMDPIPSGMTIDGGLILWPTPLDGQPISVRAADGRGGFDLQEFTLAVISATPGSITGTVFDDANENGQRDAGETGLPDWNVYADRNGDRHRDADEPQAATGAAGQYVLADLLSGSYTVLLERPVGWVQTTPASPTSVTIAPADPDVTGPDFGLVQRDNPNHLPVFTSTPPTAALVAHPLDYTAAADDPDDDPLEYTLAYGPAGMAVERRSGRVVWTPSPTQTGIVYATLRVHDGRGGVALQALTLTVTGTNDAPVFLTQPDRLARLQDGPYTYDADAEDPINPAEPIRYWLDQASLLRGMSVSAGTGLLSWPNPAVGRYDVTVWAADEDGQTAYQFYQLRVTDEIENLPPQVGPDVVLTIPAEVPFFHRVEATDPDGDPLAFALDPASPAAGLALNSQPSTLNPLLSWTPTPAQVTDPGVPLEFRVRVNDGPGGHTVDQFYRLHVVAHQPANSPPEIVSTPRRTALVGEVYAYQAVAQDPEGHSVRWELEQHPAGMTIDADTGLILYAPPAAEVGPQTVVVKAIDTYAAAARQPFTLMVSALNRPPYITSPARTWATVEQVYTYAVAARDPDGQTLRFELPEAPAAASIDPQTGLITWMPEASDEGQHPVAVRVLDTLGLDAVQTFWVNVQPTPPNHPPIIRNAPDTVAVVGKRYEYRVDAVDPDHAFSELTFEVQTDPAVQGLGFVAGQRNLLRWESPPANLASPQVWVTVRVSDPVPEPDRGVAEKRYVLTVRQNNLPALTVADQTITAGRPFAYDVTASDADPQDTLTYALVLAGPGSPDPAPAGMTIDPQLGRIRWQDTVVGQYPLIVSVSDGIDVVEQPFTLHVLPDDQPPTVQLAVGQSVVDPGQPVWIWVLATDDVGVTARTLTIDGQNVSLDAAGAALFTVGSEVGHVYQLVATAADAAGNVSTPPATAQLRIRDPNGHAPRVTLQTPADGAVITDLTPIVGSIDDQDGNLAWYTITVAPLSGEGTGRSETFTATSNLPPDSTLGYFDPTVLANGSYLITVTAGDVDQWTGSSQRVVEVEGNLKLGNFTLTFTDLELPVSGIPITITRTYDTLQAGQQGDFGYGWRMDLVNVKVEVVQSGNDSGVAQPFQDGDRLVFTLPDGSQHGFTFYGEAINQGLPISDPQAYPAFRADVGVSSTLSLSDPEPALLRVAGGYEDPAMNRLYNPATGLYGDYELTLRNGTKLYIDPQDGELRSLVDRTGNTLTFSQAGIIHSGGRSVQFVRDFRGRITDIVLPDETPDDPNDNARITYTYDAYDADQNEQTNNTYHSLGDLLAVTDRTGATTRFQYLAPDPEDPDDPTYRPHYLATIIDPLGRDAARTEYDEKGRVWKVTDADGKRIEYEYPNEQQWAQGEKFQTVTDQLGYRLKQTLDSRGNVIREEELVEPDDPPGRVMLRTYDPEDHLTSETTVVGLIDSESSETNDLTTTYVYDDQTGDLLETVDPRGNSTRTYYNSYGQPTATIDALNNATSNFYDHRGLLDYVEDPSGNRTSFEYDEKGNLTQVYNDEGIRLVESTYSPYGDVTSTTSAAGRTTHFAYDIDGNQIATWYTDASVGGNVQILDVTHCDESGRVVQTGRLKVEFDALTTYPITDAAVIEAIDLANHTDVLWYSDTQYNAAGQTVRSTDQHGLATETTYDVRGQQIQTRTEARETRNPTPETRFLLSRTFYDPKGRAVVTTGSFLEEKEPGQTFDNYTATTATFSVYDGADRVVETHQLKNVTIAIVETLPGNPNSYVAQLQVGSVTFEPPEQQSDPDAAPYHQTYIGALWQFFDAAGAIVSSTETVYDNAGRVTSSLDQYGNETRTLYNTTGDVIQTATETRSVSEGGTPETVWLVSRSVYDEYGRVVLATDRFAVAASFQLASDPSPPTLATRTSYDALGRAWKTERLKDVVVDIENGTTTVTAAGTVLSNTRTIYNDGAPANGTAGDVILGQWIPGLAGQDPVQGQVAVAQVHKSIAADGQVTEYEYDKLGRQIATIGHAVPADSVALPDSVLSTLSSPLSTLSVRHRSETVYDAEGRVALQRANVVQVEDALGNISVDRSAAQETTYGYDQFGNRVKTTFGVGTPVESFVLVHYDKFGRQEAEMQQTEALYLADWDDDASSFVVAGWDANADGQPDGTQPPDTLDLGTLIPTKSYEYDDQGRLSAVELPAVPDLENNNQVTRPRYEYGYDAQGNQTLIRDPLGRETRFTFDAQGRQLTRILPLGFGPDGIAGTPDDSTVSAGAFRERFEYDDVGRQMLHISFEGVVTAFQYDIDDGLDPGDIGRLVAKHYFADLTTYEAWNPATGQYPPVESVFYTYDAFGRTIQIVQDRDGDADPETTTDQRVETNTYNDLGQLISVATNAEGTIHYEYDALGRHERTCAGSETAPGIDTYYFFDALGRLDGVTVTDRFGAELGTPEITDYFYDLLGNLDQVRGPNGVIADYDYDSLNRLERLRHFKDNGDFSYGAGDILLAEFDYDVLADGRRSGVTETMWYDTDTDPQTLEEHETRIDWFYDAVGRLTREVYDSHDNTLDYATDYLFDLVGNRREKISDTSSGGDDLSPRFAGYRDRESPAPLVANETITYEYDANDRLLTETKDAAGTADDQYTEYEYGPNADLENEYGGDHTMQTRKTVYSGEKAPNNRRAQTDYGYNLQGRLASADIKTYQTDGETIASQTPAEYEYNTSGIRTLKIEGTDKVLYLVDGNNPTGYAQVLEELNEALQVQRAYTLGLDILSQAEAAGSVYHFLYDGHGSTRMLLDALGMVVMNGAARQVFNYDAYGNPLGFDPALALSVFQYSGEPLDQHLMMQYLDARYYDFATGRFNRLDPFSGNQLNPLTLHRYVFCHGDGINFDDPTGQFEGLNGLMSTISSGLRLAGRGALLALNAYGFASNAVSSWNDLGHARLSFSEGDVWGGIGYSAMAVVHAGLAGLSAFGLKVGMTPPPPTGFGGGFSLVGGVGAGGSVALPRFVWQAIEINPAFAQWVYTQLVPVIVSNLGNAILMATAAGGGLPHQEHHFASNKNGDFTPQYKAIADQYGLDLNGSWNKDLLPHLGRHPNEYHRFVLENMRRAAKEAGSNVNKFLELYQKYVVKPISKHPELLRKAGWQE
jgi:RHS repeat-associated protein